MVVLAFIVVIAAILLQYSSVRNPISYTMGESVPSTYTKTFSKGFEVFQFRGDDYVLHRDGNFSCQIHHNTDTEIKVKEITATLNIPPQPITRKYTEEFTVPPKKAVQLYNFLSFGPLNRGEFTMDLSITFEQDGTEKTEQGTLTVIVR